MATQSITDDFSGPVVDPTIWTQGKFEGIESGLLSINAGRGRCSIGSGPAEYSVAFVTVEDFEDCTAEVTHIRVDAQVTWRGIAIYYDEFNWASVYHYEYGVINKTYFDVMIGGVETTVGWVVNVAGTYSMRINRTGNVFRGWYDVGAGWISLGVHTAAIGSPCDVRLYGQHGFPAGGPFHVDYDDFSVTWPVGFIGNLTPDLGWTNRSNMFDSYYNPKVIEFEESEAPTGSQVSGSYRRRKNIVVGGSGGFFRVPDQYLDSLKDGVRYIYQLDTGEESYFHLLGSFKDERIKHQGRMFLDGGQRRLDR